MTAQSFRRLPLGGSAGRPGKVVCQSSAFGEDAVQNQGVPLSGSGHSAEPEPISVVSADTASVPNAAWRPIETAPTDGADVLVFVRESGEQFVAYYDAGSWVYALIPLAKGGGMLCCSATHWMPLPERPTALTWGPEGQSA
jgi:hypothetical protein